MGYFPLFIDLQDKPCLIVGGGAVAARKAEKLLPYGPKLTLVAPEFHPDLCALLGVLRIERAFLPDDIAGQTLVIAATDDPAENRVIRSLCQARSIPVNVVDNKDLCTFLFPCLIKRGDLSIGISTGGASPTAAVWLKKQVEQLVPEGFDALLAWLEAQRPRIKAAIPEAKRSAVFSGLFAACVALGRPMTEMELQNFLEEEGR